MISIKKVRDFMVLRGWKTCSCTVVNAYESAWRTQFPASLLHANSFFFPTFIDVTDDERELPMIDLNWPELAWPRSQQTHLIERHQVWFQSKSKNGQLASPPHHSWQNDLEINAWSTRPFARPLGRLLAPHNQSLAPHCWRRSRTPLRSFIRSLAHSLIGSQAHGKEFF